jgi:hypothetical protein
MTFGLLLALALTAEDGGAAVSTTPPSLLQSAIIKVADGAPNAPMISDGVASTDADVWDNPRAAKLAANGQIVWELPVIQTIGAMRIQADNNDLYLVSGSLDGTTWFPIWTGGAVELPGVQTRTSPELRAQAKFLRLTASGGDSMYSITELEVFDSMASLQGAKLERAALPVPPPPAPAPPFDTGFLVVFGVVALAVGYFIWARSKNPA